MKPFRWFFDNFLNTYGGKTDVIGMSYYPYWIGSSFENTIDDLAYNLTEMAQRYGKEVMVCEIGADEADAAGSYELVQAVIDAVHSVPEGKGLGSTGGNRKQIPIFCQMDILWE